MHRMGSFATALQLINKPVNNPLSCIHKENVVCPLFPGKDHDRDSKFLAQQQGRTGMMSPYSPSLEIGMMSPYSLPGRASHPLDYTTLPGRTGILSPYSGNRYDVPLFPGCPSIPGPSNFLKGSFWYRKGGSKVEKCHYLRTKVWKNGVLAWSDPI